MDSSTELSRQQLMAKKDELKQRLLDQLAELYFLRNNGQMYEFQAWPTKGLLNSQLANIDDEDIKNDQKFSQLLNLNKYSEPPTLEPAKRSLNDSISPPAVKRVRSSLSASTGSSLKAAEIEIPASEDPTRASSNDANQAQLDSDASSSKPSVPVNSSQSVRLSNSGAEDINRATPSAHDPYNEKQRPSDSTREETDDKDSRNDQKFSHLLNLNKYSEPPTLEAAKGSLNDSIRPPTEDRVRSSLSTLDAEIEIPANEDPTRASASITVEAQPDTDTSSSKPSVPVNSSQSVRLSSSGTEDTTRAQHPTHGSLDLYGEKQRPSGSTSQEIVSDQVIGVADERQDVTSRKLGTEQVLAKKEPTTPSISVSSLAPTSVSAAIAPTITSAENNQRQNAERVKHEAAVTSRIAELRKQGLWSARRLPKLQEPSRPKTHWDYLLEEAKWLHSDYKHETKWKRDAARKLAHAAYRSVHNKKTQVARIEREKVQYVRKIAASLSKEVRSFWSSIEKIVDFRQQTKLEETRKKAWGLHLNYILDQTSKFSNSYLEDQSQPPSPPQKMATNEIGNNYLNNKESEDITMKDTVITNDEQTEPKQSVDDLAAGAESIQPKGNTFETTTVSTRVPFLLKHSLREYQHIGLDWLVAMYKKQLNGILADEMGLGKTIQTIALLAYLACEEQEWGPHLIVVPTSVMLNWEMEFKKWCPAFKILTYFGTPKERKMKRTGWSRPNSFHVCITSYRIVIQDHAAFRRKQWCYFILDEAHYIKNFKSQRWQMLLNFNSQRRLLLTGTPLQNDLMELWSLMHFLMPSLFDSLREFKDWFVNPLTGMVEGSSEYNQELVQRLHKVLRPFLLRRLKADVEKQLPQKKEVIRYCRLSKRQRFLYEEFMSLSKTKETLASGNFLSVINVLMQLRKVCNHPNLFEPRPIVSPFRMSNISYKIPGLVTTPLDYDPDFNVNLQNLQLSIANIGSAHTSLTREYVRLNKVPRQRLLEEITEDESSESASTIPDDGSSEMEIDDAMDAANSELVTEAFLAVKKVQREEVHSRLQLIASLNDARCDRINSPYFSDISNMLNLTHLDKMVKYEDSNIFSNGNGRILSSMVGFMRSNPRYKLNYLTHLLDEAIRSPEQLVESMSSIIERYIFCVPGVCSTPVSLQVSHENVSKKVQEIHIRKTLYNALSPKFDLVNKIMVNMQMSFPELRLIEYDCGKLQALGNLLIDLKANDHRVLIFTQMSRMLDILEQFLNYHGHTYLRLDGATKIDQRQILMERFNNDKRIFCFILSTRSGGIGVNLTGADTVIFYDSDWNPTMDAQAQDRCHRIGQTRNVTIYRLISEDTIEQNIYRKAQQKRMLGDLAIEEGNFNTSCFKRHAIQELFERNNEPLNVPSLDTAVTSDGPEEVNKIHLNKLEQALSKCEADAGEEMDVDAIKVAKADVDTDLREFDENIPLTEDGLPIEKSEKEQQIDTIVSQMTPVEQYAVKFLEKLHQDNFRDELEQAEKEYIQELENKKSQWEQSRIDALKEQAVTNQTKEEDSKTMLTYPKGAKCEHVQFMLDGSRKVEEMPLWAPPTPPTSPPSPVEESSQFRYQPAMTPAMAARINAMGGLSSIFGFGSESNKTDARYYINEKDIYIDHSAHFLYESEVMLESQLPPINQRYTENEATSYTIGTKKIRLTGTPVVTSGYLQTSTQAQNHQQHLQNLTNVPSTPDGSVIVAGQQPARKPKVRRDEVICLPRSLFDHPQGNHVKARRDLKLQKLRCITKGNDSDPFAMQKFFHQFSYNSLGQSLPQETIVHHVSRQVQQYPNAILLYQQEQLPRWTIQEEWAILMVIQQLQDLPVNLCILTPGHTPNWELVSEVVSDIGFTYRSFKMCEYHFAREIQKREMTRDSSWDERSLQSSQLNDGSQSSVKKSKKQKNQQANTDGLSSQQSSTSSKTSNAVQSAPFKPSKTGGMLSHDRSLQLFLSERYNIIKRIRQNQPKTLRSRYVSQDRIGHSPNQLARDDKRWGDYERTLKPEAVIKELAEEKKRRVLAARQAGHMGAGCGCCRTPNAATISR